MATLLLSGAGSENGSMDRPKQNIPDRIKLGVVHPLLRAVTVILDDEDPKPKLNISAKITKKKV